MGAGSRRSALSIGVSRNRDGTGLRSGAGLADVPSIHPGYSTRPRATSRGKVDAQCEHRSTVDGRASLGLVYVVTTVRFG